MNDSQMTGLLIEASKKSRRLGKVLHLAGHPELSRIADDLNQKIVELLIEDTATKGISNISSNLVKTYESTKEGHTPPDSTDEGTG